MCENEDSGGRRINQTRSEGASVRRIKKTIGKTNWFKDQKKFVSIFVVFHFGRLSFWSSSILVVFHFGQSLILFCILALQHLLDVVLI